LIFASATDYLDGKLARILKQTSRFGEILDPATDRIYIFAILYLLWHKDILPTWLVILLISRDAILLLMNWLLSYRRLTLMKVTFLGKAATFNLLYALPLLFVSSFTGQVGKFAFIFGWAFGAWGIALYFITGLQYFLSSLKSIRFPSQTIVN
jgi:cardiolipin synthase